MPIIKNEENATHDFVFIVSIFDLIENPKDFEMLCKLLSLNIAPEWLEKEYENEDGYENDVRYRVGDCEGNEIEFYCSDVIIEKFDKVSS